MKFNFVFLGQSVLKYRVPLYVYNSLNKIYETTDLPRANKALAGKIAKEHSLYYQGDGEEKMKKHINLPTDIIMWFHNHFKHYLAFNNIKRYEGKLISVWINEMKEHEYNPVHVHQGQLFTGLSSVMILKLPKSYGTEYSSSEEPANGRLSILGSSSGHFAKIDFSPDVEVGDFFIFPYDVRHCVNPFNGPETRRTLAANFDVKHNPIENRGAHYVRQ